MKFIDKPTDTITKSSSEAIYNQSGNLDSETTKVFAKSLFIDLGDNKTQKRFFIRTYNNAPFDPNGPEARREIWNRTELKSVSQSTFDLYIKYLNTKNSLYMTRTQRSYING